MAVSEQTPYIEYTANGIANSFALEFDCDNQDHLIVLVDDVEPVVGAWSLNGGAVVFNTAPTTGKKITIQRNTPFRRDGDFQSYDNSFRPPGVNKGFDKIWLKLQELGVADWILSNRINDLRAYVDKQDNVLQDNIDSLKNYVDDKDDELRNYLLNAIQEQGVALDQLEEYYSYLMQQLAQVAIDRGWAASFIVSADGSTQQEINDFGGAKWWNKPLGYDVGSTVKLENGDIVKSTVANNIVDPNVDMTGWVKSNAADQLIDATGENQQTLNEMMLNTNLMYRGAVPNQNTVSIHTIFAAVANSLNDGDKLTIPSGNWYWNGQAVITKQINIECLGVIDADYRVNSAHVVFQPPVDYTFNAFDFVTAMPKGAKKLTLKDTFAGNLSDYFVVMSSTEVAMHRAGFSEDYLKYLVFDITKDDFTLRDPLPFGINDLTKATLKLVKKRQPVQHRGFNFNTQNTGATTVQGHSIMYNYASNVRVVDALINQGKNGMFGDAISISNSYNIQHENCVSVSERVQTDTTYNFLIYNSAYCSFHKCSNLQKGTGTYNTQSGIVARHGYMITIDDCNLSQIDDHWGYDYLIINSHLERGVSLAGGSVTIKNCTGDVIFSQRVDPPFNEGELTIEGCKYYSNLIKMLGHDWVNKDYATRKHFDIINIKNVNPIASMVNPDRTEIVPKMILMRDPQLDEVNVYRDTILNIDSVSLINDVSGRDPIQLIDCFNESEDKIYLNYDKKRMFSSINLTNVKSLFLNGANAWRVGITPVCDILNIGEGCQNIEFLRMRARKINISNGIIANVGTGNRFFDCETLTISGMDMSQLTSSLAHIAKANRYYQNTDVYIYNSKLPSQLYIWNAFTNPATAVVEGIKLKIGSGNSIANYDMGGRGDPFIPDVRNYNSDLIVRYATPSIITLAAGAESAIYELNFPQVKAADSIVGRFDTQQDISVTVVAPTSYNNGRNKVHYRMKNTSTASISIPAGEFLTFRIV